VTAPTVLRVGDRVRLADTTHTVIAVVGTQVRLADAAGAVIEVRLAQLLAAEGFEVAGARPRAPVPPTAPLEHLPEAAVAEAVWWERHILEVLRGLPPDAPPGTCPKPAYDPACQPLTRREQAKAAELTSAGHPVTASAVAKRRRRYEARGLLGMVDHRVDKRMPRYGRAEEAVVAAMRQAVAEAAGGSSRTAGHLFWRVGQILEQTPGQEVRLPSRRTLYRLFAKVSAGTHTTGSARTRCSLAARPEPPFGQLPVAAPGELVQADSTPLDVLVRLGDGVTGRVELTGMIDTATRTVTAAVLRPTTKSVDASLLLARTVTPEPMRPGWAQALAMSASALPHRRLLDIDTRLEHAAAHPVIIPETIVIDHDKVFVSANFRASCQFLGINFQPTHEGTPTDKPHIEKMLGSVGSLFAQFVAGYTGSSVERRGRGVEGEAVWPICELQDLLDEWVVACWQNRPHDGLRDPAHPSRAFTPNEKYAALVEAAGYVPVALSADDYIELLPATWRAVNAYGIKIKHRTYDGEQLNPLRHQHSGVAARRGLWEVHYDPYDVSRVWVRDHWNGGWVTLFWNQLHRVAAPFGELAWDHTRRGLPGAGEEQVADAVADLLARASRGPACAGGTDTAATLTKRDRRVAAHTTATQPQAGRGTPRPAAAGPTPAGENPPGGEGAATAEVTPMPVFDPFTEADKRW
jgi:hypothetical protein